MARGPVWIEAYEQYLLRKNVCEKSELERLSDDALAEKYFQYVREADCEEAAFDWVQKYCRQLQYSMTSVYLKWCTEVFCILVRYRA